MTSVLRLAFKDGLEISWIPSLIGHSSTQVANISPPANNYLFICYSVNSECDLIECAEGYVTLCLLDKHLKCLDSGQNPTFEHNTCLIDVQNHSKLFTTHFMTFLHYFDGYFYLSHYYHIVMILSLEYSFCLLYPPLVSTLFDINATQPNLSKSLAFIQWRRRERWGRSSRGCGGCQSNCAVEPINSCAMSQKTNLHGCLQAKT